MFPIGDTRIYKYYIDAIKKFNNLLWIHFFQDQQLFRIHCKIKLKYIHHYIQVAYHVIAYINSVCVSQTFLLL